MAKKKTKKKKTALKAVVQKKSVSKKKANSNGEVKKKKKAKLVGKRVKLEYEFPSGLKPIFSNNFVVQHEGNEFFLMFFDARSPCLLGDEKEKEEQLKALKSIKAECVAKIVVSSSAIPSIIKVLGENFQKQQAKAKATDQAQG